MKNICFVCYDLSVMGGAEKVATAVANALSDKYNVFMVSLTGGEPFLALDNKVHYTNLGLDLSRLRKGILPATKALNAFYKENDIQLSFIEGNYAGLICSLTSLVSKTAQVFHDHGSLMSQWDRKDIRTIRRIASKLCKYTMVLTNQSRKDYIRMMGLKESKVSFIHNWIDHLPEINQYDTSCKYIMTAGRFASEKRFHDLLPEVATAVMDKHPDWQWHIYGDGEFFDETKSKLSELNLTDFIQLKGMVTDLDNRYKDYSMYVMTSDREGMPLVLLEAKANGLPIVSFDIITGPAEIVREGEDGYLVPFGDVDKMANRICQLIENKELRQSMSAKAYADRDRFSKSEILRQWIDYIESH